MRLFPSPLHVGDEEGFTKDKDIFNRSTIGRGLTNLVCRVTDPLVIAIDNEWGTGKTIFLKMWAGELRKRSIPVVYFDAFEHDYIEDAFTAIASEIVALTTQKRAETEPGIQKFLKSSKGAAKVLLRTGLKLGVKLGTAGALNAADFGGISNEFAKEASELEDKYLGELLTKKAQEKLAIQSFRDALETLPSMLAPHPNDSADGSEKVTSPLIIIVDELDRCRPIFALQILERIKHFFSVPSVHFVLGTHLGQLRNSVSAVYGSGIDSRKYLEKFISLTVHLTEDAYHPHQRTTSIYIGHLISSMELEAFFLRGIDEYFQHLAYQRKLSLRAIERILSTLAIALASKSKNAFCSDPILIGLCALKVLSPEVYVSAKSGDKVYLDARGPLALDVTPLPSHQSAVERLNKVWKYYSDPSIADDNPEYQGFGQEMWQYNLERWGVVAHVARAVVDRLSE